MLRAFLLVAALATFAVGLGARLTGGRPWAAAAIVWGAVVACAILIERWRYRPAARAKDGEWQRTDEQFIDPESGRPIQVFYNPRSGERRYGSPADGRSAGVGDEGAGEAGKGP